MVVSVRAWGHAGHVGDLGASEGWPDVWWGWMHVWVGPVAWGIVEGHHWGSGASLWGLGYVVWQQPEGLTCGQRVCRASRTTQGPHAKQMRPPRSRQPRPYEQVSYQCHEKGQTLATGSSEGPMTPMNQRERRMHQNPQVPA